MIGNRSSNTVSVSLSLLYTGRDISRGKRETERARQEWKQSVFFFIPNSQICSLHYWSFLLRSLKALLSVFFFLINLFIYLFIFGCIGSSLLRATFL